MEEHMLKIEHLTKVYDNGVKALHDVSMTIPDGQFVVIIGLSGSGKSTLLRCINRLVEPSSGRIVFDGVDVSRARGAQLRSVRRRIGMIFQQFNLVKRSSVFANVLAGRLGARPLWRTLTMRPTREEVALAFQNLERVGIVDKAYARAD